MVEMVVVLTLWDHFIPIFTIINFAHNYDGLQVVPVHYSTFKLLLSCKIINKYYQTTKMSDQQNCGPYINAQ